MEKIINFDINEYVEDSDKILQIEELCKDNIQIDTNDIEAIIPSHYQCQFLISSMSIPYSLMYSLCFISFSKIRCHSSF